MKISECYEQYKNNNKEYWKERTLQSYNERCLLLIQKFGDVDIDIFTHEFLQNYITKEQKDNKRKASAIRNELRLLLSIIQPYKTFGRFKYITTEQDLEKKKIYSADDIAKIQDYILSYQYWKSYRSHRYESKQTYMPIMIAINTGMRLSEIIGLKWKDINFELKHIEVKREVYKAKNGQIIESLPKTKCGYRTIPMNNILSDYLLDFKSEDLETFVLTNTDKPKCMRVDQRTNEKLLNKIGIKCLG